MLSQFVRQVADSLLHPRQNDHLKAQAFRQMASGTVATLTDLVIFKIGLTLSINILALAVITVWAGAAVNFTITRYYVYGETQRQRSGALAQALFYIPTVLVSMGLTQLILFALCVKLNLPPMPIRVFVAVPVVFFWTLFSGKYLVFAKRPMVPEPSGVPEPSEEN